MKHPETPFAPCCGFLFIILAELGKWEEQRNLWGVIYLGVKRTEEELQSDEMGVRASATKGKSGSVVMETGMDVKNKQE